MKVLIFQHPLQHSLMFANLNSEKLHSIVCLIEKLSEVFFYHLDFFGDLPVLILCSSVY